METDASVSMVGGGENKLSPLESFTEEVASTSTRTEWPFVIFMKII
jgi:hypothetical protein